MIKQIQVLDHGYVRLVELWGADERIIESARMSTQKGFEGWGPKKYKVLQCDQCMLAEDELKSWEEQCIVSADKKHSWTLEFDRYKDGDEKLLKYLAKHHHDTPFEFAGAIFEMQMPIFVIREWHRHRTQSYTEASARYGPLPNLHYMPSRERCLPIPGETNRQARGSSDRVPVPWEADAWLSQLAELYDSGERLYQHGLELGIPKEIARCAMFVSRYTKMRASANLRNWAAFLKLRMAPNAQEEIRLYAKAVHTLLRDEFPRSIPLLVQG